MARAEQSRIKRYILSLRKNSFAHNDVNKYYFKCWNTKRNGSGTSYTDEQACSLQDDTVLYAIWQERNILTRYENLSITADNVAWDKESTTIHYSLYEIKYYEGSGYVISKTQKTGTSTSVNFGKNGEAYSETATKNKTHVISYTANSFPNKNDNGNIIYLTATTTITLYGYTPVFYVDVIYDSGKTDIVGYIPEIHYPCTLPDSQLPHILSKKAATKVIIDEKTVRFSSTSKQMLIVSNPTKYYSFTHWSGSTVDGNTKSNLVINGATINLPVITANLKLNPLLTNTVVSINGKHNKTITTTKYETRTAVGWHWVWHWLGWWWGWWFWESYTYTYQVTINNTTKTDYYNAADVKSPYIITIPANGLLTIKGLYGIKIYGCSCTRVGGFDMYLNEKKVKTYNNTIKNTDLPFEFSINVKRGDIFEIGKTFSTTANHIAVWVDFCTIDENKALTTPSKNEYYSEVMYADNLRDFKQQFDIAELAKGINDHSINVVLPGKMTRDLNNLPKYTTTYETKDQQEIVKIKICGCHGYGYTRLLKITNISDYIDNYGETKQKNNVVYDSTYGSSGGELINRQCYIYMPSYSKIQIDACWHRVDTLNFGVDLFIQSYNFKTIT